jgi:hypothetical protein
MLWLLWLGLAPPAAASSLVRMDLAALSSTADRILFGTVLKIESHYLTPDSHYIVTDVTVRSERNLLGVPEGSQFVVRHLGGEVGKLGQRVYGEASYRVGEQVLLFAALRQGAYYAVGMAQGALHVYRDNVGVPRVQAHLGKAELLGAQSIAAAQGHALEDVITKVQAYLDGRVRKQGP